MKRLAGSRSPGTVDAEAVVAEAQLRAGVAPPLGDERSGSSCMGHGISSSIAGDARLLQVHPLVGVERALGVRE
jgi:hypothetical protein